MREGVVRRFGARIRARLKSSGVGNVHRLFKSAGYGGDIPSDMARGRTADVGALKLAHASILAGVHPAEMFQDLADTLLNPPLLRHDDAEAIKLQGWPHNFPDQQRLAVIADTVVQAMEDQKRPEGSGAAEGDLEGDTGKLVQILYDRFVKTDPGIAHLELRRQVFAFMLNIDLPQPDQRRGRSLRAVTRG